MSTQPTDAMIEQAAIYAWEAAPSRWVGCFRLWNEVPEREKEHWRKIALAARTPPPCAGDDVERLIHELSLIGLEYASKGLERQAATITAAIEALGTTPSIAPDIGRPYGQPAGHEPSLASRLGPAGDHQAQGE